MWFCPMDGTLMLVETRGGGTEVSASSAAAERQRGERANGSCFYCPVCPYVYRLRERRTIRVRTKRKEVDDVLVRAPSPRRPRRRAFDRSFGRGLAFVRIDSTGATTRAHAMPNEPPADALKGARPPPTARDRRPALPRALSHARAFTEAAGARDPPRRKDAEGRGGARVGS